MPAYKTAFFELSLQSLRNQSYTDFCVIVSDDCSPDPIYTIFEKTVGNDKRFSYRRNVHNIGSASLVSHWNLLVEGCDSEYIIMASDDDVYDLNFLSEVNRLINKYPDADLIRARTRVIDEDDFVIVQDSKTKEFLSQDEFLHSLVVGKMNPCLANYVFKTEGLKKVGGFVEFPLAWGSDEATVLKMSSKGVICPPDILFSFRQSGYNISSTTNNVVERKKMEARKQYISFLKSFFSSLPHKDDNKYNKRIAQFKNVYYSRMVDQLLYRVWYLSFFEIIQHYFYLIRINAFPSLWDKIKYLWTWYCIKRNYNRIA